MPYKPDPANDPNDAYAVIHTPGRAARSADGLVTLRTEAGLLFSAPATQQKQSAMPAVRSSLCLNVS